MYFSRNSRYVLQRVRFLSPTFLNSSKKSLSVKKPKDDPKKPPLRINIPKDTSKNDDYTKFIQNSSTEDEPRSKSLITRSRSTPFGSSFEDNILIKSESEIQLSQLRSNDTLIKNNYVNIEASNETCHPQSPSKEDYNEGSKTVLNDEVTEKALAEKFLTEGASNQNYESGRNTADSKNLKIPPESSMEDDPTSKSLYIIIDVPKTSPKNYGSDMKHAKPSEPYNHEEAKTFSNRTRLSSSVTKANLHKTESNSSKKTKSFSRFNFDKTKLNVSKKFEVHEIEDAATYIFHLKFSANSWRKPCGVGWVPEKEVTTRNENLNYNEPPIKVRKPFGPNASGMGKDVTIVDQLPKLVKFSDNKKKQKVRETERKANLLALDKTSTAPQWKPPAEAIDGENQVSAVSQPVNLVEKIPYVKEERKLPQKFVQDDFGAVKLVSKTYPFRLPIKSNEKEHEESNSQENSSDFPPIKKQEACTEAPSNSTAEVTEMPKEANTAATASQVNNFLQSNDENLSQSTLQQYTYFPASEAGPIKNYATDSYVQYLGERLRAPKTTETSNEGDWKRNIVQYPDTYEKEANETKTSPESVQGSNYSQNCSTNEKVLAKGQSPTKNNQHGQKSQYLSIHGKPAPSAVQIPVENDIKKSESEYCKIRKKVTKANAKKPNKSFQGNKIPKKKLENSYQDNSSIQTSKGQVFEKTENEITNFQPSASFVSIECDKIQSNPMTYSAAFPPLVREALDSRFRFRKDFLFIPKWTKIDTSLKDANPKLSHKNKVSELSENSILFPKNESEKFDCDSLFCSKEEIILNIIKNAEMESSPKRSNNVANFANESLTENHEKPSVDSLTMMKKVKEIIQLDLDNAVKIFKSGQSESGKELPSVVVLKGNSWEVDTEELKRQTEMRMNEMKIASFIDLTSEDNIKLTDGAFGDRIDTNIPKYLPPKEKKSFDMKLLNHELNSVITFNPKTEEFFINKEALEDAIKRRTNESREEVFQTLAFLSKNSKNSLDIRRGDSILVFDEETQSWKVDFSILEKREQEFQLEKELTKTSELILETFEKLEKDQISTIPKPDSKNKQTFDYATEKWKIYDENKTPNEKSTKSKSLFKESNAEEIRRKNSDLYEDLFLAKKKETTVKKANKIAPGLDSSKTSKESKSGNSGEKKEASDGSLPKDSGSAPKDPKPPKSDSKLPPLNEEKPTQKYDDNFWESFLKMNILPRDVRELPNPLPPPKPPAPAQPPGPRTPGGTAPKIEEPKSKTPEKKIEEPKLKAPNKKIDDSELKIPEKKIEEPKFRIYLPFIKDRKNDPKKTTNLPVSKEESKSKDEKKAPPLPGAESPDKKTPPPPAGATSGKKEVIEKKKPPSTGASSEKKEKIDKKAPPLPATSSPKSDPKNDLKQPPTIGSSKSSTPPDKTPNTRLESQKSPSKGKNDKSASATDHYVSDKIIEMSKNKTKENQTKIKTPKIETVKLNLTTEKRLPSKITEINLNKKCEEKEKDLMEPPQNSLIKAEKSLEQTKTLYKNLEKYKTPLSDPEYEENSMKIKSDIESNPNLNKLENWNKTLVLHDIVKPSESIENWLKDETDKMATLLLKILQETTDGKPKKRHPLGKSKIDDKKPVGANPYENIRKKREVTPENFLFRVRTVNLSLENDKKAKPEKLKDISVQSGKSARMSSIENAEKLITLDRSALAPTGASTKEAQLPANLDMAKTKMHESALETVVYPVLMNRDFAQQNKLPLEVTEEIPGPEILKKISNAWKVFPILGTQMTIFTLFRVFQLVNMGSSILGHYNSDKIRRSAFVKLFSKHGPIVNIQGPLSGNVILIHKPEHVTAVFEQDTLVLVRSVFDSLEHIRKDLEERVSPNPFRFDSVNVSVDWSKPIWNDLRRGTSDPLFRGCEKYFRTVEMAGNSLINNIRKNKNSQNLVSEDFMEEIGRWSLEGLCSVLFEKSFGFLEGRMNSSWIMEPDKLYMAINKATQYLNKCEKGFQAWRLMGTRSLLRLSQAYRTLSSIISKQLYQAEINLKNKNELLKDGILFPLRELNFIESMLLNDGMTTEEVSCNLIDILLIGTNSMNSAMGFLLYNLAQNVRVQNKLLKELKELFPQKSSKIDFNKLRSLRYLEACLKESLRLHMPISIFYRMLQNDILLSNYIVPKGTYMVMDFRVSSMKEQIFDDPDKFVPERWLTDEKSTHPFSSFPFCHGPKAEFAKKVVEMQLLVCVAKIIRNFQVGYHFGEIQGTDSLINFPNKPLKLNFIERKS